MTLLEQAIKSSTTSPTPRLVTAVNNAPKKLQPEILDLIEAALARTVSYTAAARVLSEALGVKIGDDHIRKHGGQILADNGR